MRRVRTGEEVADRTPLVLTDRDQAVLRAVALHGLLTTALIERAFFPGRSLGCQKASSKLYARLRQLWLWGYLERLEPPIARVAGGRRPYLYTLGQRGVPVVSRHLGQGGAPVRRRRLDRLDSVFIEHDLTVAAFWAHLVALLRPTPVRLRRWLPERDLRARGLRVRDPVSGRWLPVLPDAAFALGYPDGRVQRGLLEVDRGTLTLSRFRRKLRAFELAVVQGLVAPDARREDVEVYVLSHSRARLKQLWQAARQEVPEDRWAWYFFAPFETLDPARFGGDEAWLDLAGEAFGLLYAPAEEDGSSSHDTDTEEAMRGLRAHPAEDAGPERQDRLPGGPHAP